MKWTQQKYFHKKINIIYSEVDALIINPVGLLYRKRIIFCYLVTKKKYIHSRKCKAFRNIKHFKDYLKSCNKNTLTFGKIYSIYRETIQRDQLERNIYCLIEAKTMLLNKKFQLRGGGPNLPYLKFTY